MKKLLPILLLFFTSIYTQAQVKYNESGALYFEEVYEAPNQSKEEIHKAVNEWIALNFKDANHVIKLNTEDKIINKGLVKSSYNVNGINSDITIEFDMISEFKDGRYKILIDDLNYRVPSGESNPISWTDERMSKEEFKIFYIDLINKMDNGQVKKFNQKILENENKFNTHYELVTGVRVNLYNAVVGEIEPILISIKNYVSKSNDTTSKDW